MKLVYKNNIISDTVGNMDGATSQSAGTAGLVPAPLSTDRDKYLKGDGTWAPVSSSASGITYDNTTSGLSADDTQEAIDELVSGLDNKANKPTVKNVTLEAGETSVTFTQIPTTGNNLITFFTSNGMNYTSIDASTSGEVTLTFDEQEEDVVVSCEIKGV